MYHSTQYKSPDELTPRKSTVFVCPVIGKNNNSHPQPDVVGQAMEIPSSADHWSIRWSRELIAVSNLLNFNL